MLRAPLRGFLLACSYPPEFLRWAAAIGWALFLWFMSARSDPERPFGFGGTFLWNGGHVVAFFILAGLALLALWQRLDCPRVRGRVSILLAAGYGITDEIHQSMVPGRDCSGWDMLSDTLGATLAVACTLWILNLASWRPIAVLVPCCFGSVALATWGP